MKETILRYISTGFRVTTTSSTLNHKVFVLIDPAQNIHTFRQLSKCVSWYKSSDCEGRALVSFA